MMGLNDAQDHGVRRSRGMRFSAGHNPPKMVDSQLATRERSIVGIGGPGKPFPRTQGTHPWIAGSFTIGSNKVWQLEKAHFEIGSPNCWFLLRHSHSGTAAIPGGTIDAWRFNATGRTDILGDTDAPLRSVRGPGTVFLYGFGRRSASTGSTPYLQLGSSPTIAFAAVLRGHIV